MPANSALIFYLFLFLSFSFINIRKIEKEKYVVREITRQITFSRSYNCGDFNFLVRGATSGGSREEQLVIDAQYKSITRNHPNRSCLMHFTLFNDDCVAGCPVGCC